MGGGGGGGGGSLVTVTVWTGGGVDGGGATLVGPTDVAVIGGSVALVLSLALVSATATPPTATTATTAASPNTNCGNRCHVHRGSSIGSVAGRTAPTDARPSRTVSYRSPV